MSDNKTETQELSKAIEFVREHPNNKKYLHLGEHKNIGDDKLVMIAEIAIHWQKNISGSCEGWELFPENIPNENEWYLIAVERHGKLITITETFLFQAGNFHCRQGGTYSHSIIDEKVIYYKPIPQPPQASSR